MIRPDQLAQSRPSSSTMAGARRAAHRVGQVGGVLRGHRAAAERGRGPDAGRVAAARPDARPVAAANEAGAGRDGELGQHRRLGRDPRPHRRRRGRPARRVARAAELAWLRRGAARLTAEVSLLWSTRPTASPTGATTSGPTTDPRRPGQPRRRPGLRARPRPTTAWWPTSPSSWGRILSSSGATSTARRCTCRCWARPRRAPRPGWPAHLGDLPGRASCTHDGGRHRDRGHGPGAPDMPCPPTRRRHRCRRA